MESAKWMLQSEWRDGAERYDPELVVTVIPQEPGDHYAIAVEMRYDEAGPFVTGIAVRRHFLAGYAGGRTNVSPRDVKRLAVAPAVRAALALASTSVRPEQDEAPEGFPTPFHKMVDQHGAWATYYDVGNAELWQAAGHAVPDEMTAVGETLAVPKGRGEPARRASFYKQVSDDARRFTAMGVSPAKGIAAERNVPANRVHQWFHTARELGFLEKSPRSTTKN